MLKRALALLVMLPGLAAAADLQTVAPGKLTWGTSPTFVPFEFVKDGKPMGFDVDLVDALAKRVGLVPDMQAMDFKGIIPGILGHRIDIGVSGFYITPERLQVVDFIAYAIVGNQIIVAKGNPKHITGPTGLCGMKVAVPVSTAFEASAKQASADCVAQGKHAADILSVPGSNLVALALSQGRVDAALNSTATAAAMMSETPDTYALAGEPFDATTKVGIAMPKDNVALASALRGAMTAMVNDGSYAALLQKWNLPKSTSPF